MKMNMTMTMTIENSVASTPGTATPQPVWCPAVLVSAPASGQGKTTATAAKTGDGWTLWGRPQVELSVGEPARKEAERAQTARTAAAAERGVRRIPDFYERA